MISDRIWSFLREASRTRREKATATEETTLRRQLQDIFKDQERLLLAALDRIRPEIDPDFVREAGPGINPLDLGPIWDTITDRTEGPMAEAFQSSAEAAFFKGASSLASDLAVDFAFDLQHPRAVAFLEQRGAALVSNIDAVTRTEVQRIITKGVREGQSYGSMRTELRQKFSQFHTPQPQLHIRDRAELIAVQEAGEAYEAGNMEMAEELQDLGVPLEKSLLTAEDERVDDVCLADESAAWIPLKDAYPSGRQRPPIHVTCRCSQLVRRIA